MQPTAEFAEPFAELPDAVEDTWGEEEVAETDDQHHGVRTIVLPATSDRPSTIEQSFVVEPECHGYRLDRFLQKKIRRLSRARIQRVIHGDCDVEGRKARPNTRVYSGQRVSFRRPAPSEPEVPRNIGIVHTDPDFYVIDKPAGLPIHPTARYHYSTLTAVLRERFPDEALQVAHRLDRETSGLMLVARNPESGSRLKIAFQKRLVHKRYLAIVVGELPLGDGEELLIDKPLGDAGTVVRVRVGVRAVADGGLPAQTVVRVLRRFPGHTLVECRPHTGRQHQIRVHLWDLGYPIVGDKLYPDEELFMKWSEEGDAAIAGLLPLPRHALHAAGIGFPHPRSGELVEFSAELPSDLARFLDELI